MTVCWTPEEMDLIEEWMIKTQGLPFKDDCPSEVKGKLIDKLLLLNSAAMRGINRWEKAGLYGAILGDIIGEPYEFDRGNKTKDFPLFLKVPIFTDDSVMTVAVAEALLDARNKNDNDIRQALIGSMRKWGKLYPWAGYGGRFREWLKSDCPKPYWSYGNGAAMRASSAGWLFGSLSETRKMARLTAEVTHNHPEGIKGAEAVASVIWLASYRFDKERIKAYVEGKFGYDLSRTCNEIRPVYFHKESCQETVPEAITAFLEGSNFEDVIRTAVSLGGDCDTLTCIAGSMAEAYYGVPEQLKGKCKKILPENMLMVLRRFDAVCGQMKQPDELF